MDDDLRKQAKQKVATQKAFYQCAILFSATALVLFMLSFYLTGIAFWLRLPIPILFAVLGVLYVSAFGLSTDPDSGEDWEEEAIAREETKLRRQQQLSLPPLEDLSEADKLELKELERLRAKWDNS